MYGCVLGTISALELRTYLPNQDEAIMDCLMTKYGSTHHNQTDSRGGDAEKLTEMIDLDTSPMDNLSFNPEEFEELIKGYIFLKKKK